MISNVPIGTLSISEQILKDQTPLRDRYDLVLAAVSWESRCHCCANRRAYILCGVVEDEVFEVHQFAVDPERSTGVCEMGVFDKALTGRRTGDALVETRQR